MSAWHGTKAWSAFRIRSSVSWPAPKLPAALRSRFWCCPLTPAGATAQRRLCDVLLPCRRWGLRRAADQAPGPQAAPQGPPTDFTSVITMIRISPLLLRAASSQVVSSVPGGVRDGTRPSPPADRCPPLPMTRSYNPTSNSHMRWTLPARHESSRLHGCRDPKHGWSTGPHRCGPLGAYPTLASPLNRRGAVRTYRPHQSASLSFARGTSGSRTERTTRNRRPRWGFSW
jgi:hypothetical protein